MKYLNPFLLLFFLLCTFSYHSFAQSSRVFLQQQMRNHQLEAPVAVDQFFEQYASRMGLNQAEEMIWSKEIPGRNGFAHHRYTQAYNGIPVFGSSYTLHAKAGQVFHSSGYFLPRIDLSTSPRLSPESAIKRAIQTMDAELYAWEKGHAHGDHFHATYARPEANLYIIDESFPKNSESYKLVYSVILYSLEPHDRRQYFIDANNGMVLLDLPMLPCETVPATGVTKYYGEGFVNDVQ
ncbi:MAG: hypothetical protein AAFP19_13015, partial [Bacteroidota bacterium]